MSSAEQDPGAATAMNAEREDNSSTSTDYRFSVFSVSVFGVCVASDRKTGSTQDYWARLVSLCV